MKTEPSFADLISETVRAELEKHEAKAEAEAERCDVHEDCRADAKLARSCARSRTPLELYRDRKAISARRLSVDQVTDLAPSQVTIERPTKGGAA